jgi:hypothetical protein
MLTSAFATAVAVVSCGGGSHKKAHYVGEAGEGGVAGEPAGPSPTGGSGATAPMGGKGGKGGEGNQAGTGPGGSAGAAGGESTDTAGAAGAPPVIVTPMAVAHLLFTVAPGATGLAGTALAAQANPQSVIFGSSSENPDPTNGTNSVLITGDQLGLAATDTIDAFGALQPKPVHPVYFFSVASGSGGGVPTRLARSAETDQAIGDVYFSDGSLSFRAHNEGETEGGDQFGYNGLVADEVSLGLSAVAPVEHDPDDLTGVQLLPDGLLPTRIYFSVSPDSVGLSGTAVAGASADDRACTIFQSNLDGTNSVAFTCAQLGLLAASDVKALTVFGTTTPTEILFSVSGDSTGVAESAVYASTDVGGDVFASTGDGQNSQRVERRALGIAPGGQLDALTTVDRAAPGYSYASTCTLTPSPMSADSIALDEFYSAHGLGNGLILVQGDATPVEQPQVTAIGAYDVKTCAFVAGGTIKPNVLDDAWTPVQLPGWTAADPLKNLEYWELVNVSGTVGVERLDATGQLLNTFVMQGAPEQYFYHNGLTYDPVHDAFYGGLLPVSGSDESRIAFKRPAAGATDDTLIQALVTPIPQPCANTPPFIGVDAAGNSIFGQRDTAQKLRGCALSPSGELANLPFDWSAQDGTFPTWGVLVPEEALYMLDIGAQDNTIFSIGRYPLTQ